MAEDLHALVDEAFTYALPLQVIAATRWRAVADATNPERHAPNTLRHIRQLSDHRSRWITAPNNDTLYSNAWLDLSGAPVRLRVAAQPAGRYWSVALMDAFSNHIAVLGQRRHGTGPVEVTMAGPRQRPRPLDGDLAGRVIHAPGNDVWLFARCLVDGPDDLPMAHAMQDRITLQPLAAAPVALPAAPGDLEDPAAFLATVNGLLSRNPPPPADAPLLTRCDRVGLRPGDKHAWATLDNAARAAWQAHLGEALARVRAYGTRGRRDFDGWIASAADIGNFGTHYALRASVALGGLGALEPDEAMYFVRYTDDDGAPLDGAHRYQLDLPPCDLPTDSFWSFTMYEATADGRRFLVDNAIGRHAVGNRTAGLQRDANGVLTLCLQHAAPHHSAERANWLPAPAGRFQVALRCYLPHASLRSGHAAMPRLRRRPD